MEDLAHPADYERTDADPRLIGWLAVGIAVFLVTTPFLLMTLFPGAEDLDRIPAGLPLPPAPRLQVKPEDDLNRLRAAEQSRLTTFGWTDRRDQIVHVPIEHAMRLVVEHGLEGWPSSQSPQPASR
jgi:hypothetical protein